MKTLLFQGALIIGLGGLSLACVPNSDNSEPEPTPQNNLPPVPLPDAGLSVVVDAGSPVLMPDAGQTVTPPLDAGMVSPNDAGAPKPPLDGGTAPNDGGVQQDPWQGPGWPAEAFTQATPLFMNGPDSIAGQDNWSGAHWNPSTQTLWLARNNSGLRAYDLSGPNPLLIIDASIDEDFEGITQADLDRPEVLVLAENQQEAHHYDFSSPDNPVLLQDWDLSGINNEEDGLEGFVFVPNKELASFGFVDQAGNPFPASQGPLQGIVLISEQQTGDILAVDLVDPEPVVIGRYQTPLSSTRGLELDRNSGILYLVDGTGSARLRLSSKIVGGARAFEVISQYPGPGPGGAEGIAVSWAFEPNVWAIITDDDNNNGNTAVLWYRQF